MEEKRESLIPDPIYDWLEVSVPESPEVVNEATTAKEARTPKETTTVKETSSPKETSSVPLQPSSVLPEGVEAVPEEKLLSPIEFDKGTISLIVSIVSLCITLICKI